MRPLRLLAVASACLLAAGCSGDPEALDVSDAVATTTVTMPKSYRFDPEVIKVERGDTVTWKNEDNFTHDVTIETGTDSGEHTVEPGESVKLRFDEAGTFEYECRLHSKDMRGTVIVT